TVGANPAQAELPANNAAVRQAREKYRPIFLQADSIATVAYEKFANPILMGQVNVQAAPAIAEQYALRFDQTAKKLQKLAARLDGADEFGSRGISAHVAAAREFVEAWANYYAVFAKSLSPADAWGEQRRQDLVAEYRHVLRLYDWVRNSAL